MSPSLSVGIGGATVSTGIGAAIVAAGTVDTAGIVNTVAGCALAAGILGITISGMGNTLSKVSKYQLP